MRKSQSAGLVFIFITLFLDVLGIGIIIPVLPKLIQTFVRGDYSVASRYLGVLVAVYALMQFLCAPIIGGLSDRFGRRPVILIALFGFGIDYLILAFAPNIWWLFIGRVVAGITGATFTTGSAYIADISAPEKRAQNFGLLGAAFGLGFIIGPGLGGLLGGIDIRLPFFAAAGMALINWLYGFFILPESLSPENRRPFSWKRANPIGSIRVLSRYPVIMGMAGALICLYICNQIHPNTWALFTMKEFNWDSTEVGYSLAFVGLMVAFVQGYLTRKVIPRIGERQAVKVGLLFSCAGYLLFSLANQGWMMYAIMVPFAMGGFAGPALQSIITAQVEPSQQGELQGGLTSLMSITNVIGPLIATGLFSYFTSPNAVVHFPGAAFLMGAILTLVALFIALRTLPHPVVTGK